MKRLMWMILVLPFLGGCWDRVEIENRSFAVSIAVDSAADARFQVTLATISATSDKEKDEGNVIKASGETVNEALRTLDTQTGKRIYFGQAKVLVLGEALLNEADLMQEVLRAFEKHPEIDRKMLILAAKGEASALLEARSPDASLPGLFAAELYRDVKKTMGKSFKRDFERVNAELRSTGEALVPLAAAEEGAWRLSGALVLREFCRVGEMEGMDTRGYLWCVSNECEGAVVSVKSNNAPVSMIIEKHSAKAVFDEYDGHLRCTVQVNITGTSDRRINAEEYANEVAYEILKTAERMQTEFRVDGYGWHEMLRKKNYKLYQKYASDWGRAFLEMEIVPRITVMV